MLCGHGFEVVFGGGHGMFFLIFFCYSITIFLFRYSFNVFKRHHTLNGLEDDQRCFNMQVITNIYECETSRIGI